MNARELDMVREEELPSCVVRRRLLTLIIGCLLGFCLPVIAAADPIGLTFPVRITLDLCPEYHVLGDVSLRFKYSLPPDGTLYDLDIKGQHVNSQSNEATFDLELPSTLGTRVIQVYSFCSRSSQGLSKASNDLEVTNCDALALRDTDGDGLPNSVEDLNCDNFFSPGDISNPDNVDTDGDGVRDEVELLYQTSPTNPGSSPRPKVFSAGVFDPNQDGDSNAVVWRGSTGTYYIKDSPSIGVNQAIAFGQTGDTPFVYRPFNAPADVGAIRPSGVNLIWLFRGRGFVRSDNTAETSIPFGIFGDNIVLGAWERENVDNPGVARLYNGVWYFYIYLSTGQIRQEIWGGNGDIPKPADYDGDGLLDVAVFRPAEQKTYIIRSSDRGVLVYEFGSGTADHTVLGDYTGDGVDDISFWEPTSGLFTSLLSDHGFDPERARHKEASYYREMQLGLYFIHLPLNWNKKNGKLLYTVVDHASGLRYWRQNNSPQGALQIQQWGLAGDSVG